MANRNLGNAFITIIPAFQQGIQAQIAETIAQSCASATPQVAKALNDTFSKSAQVAGTSLTQGVLPQTQQLGQQLSQSFDVAKNASSATWQAIKTETTQVFPSIATTATQAMFAIQAQMIKASSTVQSVAGQIKQAFGTIPAPIRNAGTAGANALRQITKTANSVVGQTKSAFSNLSSSIKNTLNAGLSSARASFQSLTAPAKSAITQIKAIFSSGGTSAGQGFSSRLFSSASSGLNKLVSHANSQLKQLGSSGVAGGNLLAQGIQSALGGVSNLVNGAVSRYDELNIFPKVMNAMGQNASSAQASISKLQDRLTGLPTSLDQGTNAVRRFTSANGDVEKSTDIFVALNDAIVAGGANSGLQAAALEQFQQSYSKGFMDMLEYRSLMSAMPAQMKMIADSFGMSTDEMRDALNNGSLSMDDFTNRLLELDETGAGEMASFKDQAKAATFTVQTQIRNLGLAFQRLGANALLGLDTALKNSGLPTVPEMLNKVVTAVSNATRGIADVIGGFDLSFLKSSATPVLAIAGAFTALSGVFSTVAGAIGKLGLKLASFASPVGIVITAVGIAIGVLTQMWRESEQFRDAIKNVFDVIGQAIQPFIELFGNLGKTIADSFGEVDFGALGDSVAGFLNPLTDAFSVVLPQIETFVSGLESVLSPVIQTIINLVQQLAPVFETVFTAIGTFLEANAPVISTIIGTIGNVLQSVGSIIGSILSVVMNVVSAIIPIVTGLIEFLTPIITTIITIIMQVISVVAGIIATVISVVATVIGTVSNVWNFITSAFMGIASAVGNGIQSAIDFVLNFPDKVMECFNNAKDWLLNAGSNIIQGLLDGLSGAWGTIVNFFTNSLNGLKDQVLGFFGIHSPSRMFMWIGEMMMAGWDIGLEKNADEPLDTMRSIEHSLQPDLNKYVADIGFSSMLHGKSSETQLIQWLKANLALIIRDNAPNLIIDNDAGEMIVDTRLTQLQGKVMNYG